MHYYSLIKCRGSVSSLEVQIGTDKILVILHHRMENRQLNLIRRSLIHRKSKCEGAREGYNIYKKIEFMVENELHIGTGWS